MENEEDVIHSMDTSQEMDLIKMMLDISTREKLETEVVWAFAHALKESSADIEECVNYALSSWDLI